MQTYASQGASLIRMLIKIDHSTPGSGLQLGALQLSHQEMSFNVYQSNAFQTKMWRYDLGKFRVNTGVYSENDLFFRVH